MNKWIISLILLFAVVACHGPEPETPSELPYLRLSVQERRVPNTADVFDIDIDANCDWSVSCSDSWVEISPLLSTYHESLSLSIRVSENDGTTPRETVITFTYDTSSEQCLIHQAPFVPRLEISDHDISFGYRTAEKIIRVISNCTWEAAPESSWIAIRPVTGLVGSFEMTVNAETNPEESARSSRIHFWNDAYGVNEYVQVTQAEHPAVQMLDYIDEYGINHGRGVTLRGLTWATVNCGFEETAYPMGKMYQWGRKHGVGFQNESWQDITGPILAPLWNGNNGEEDPSTFYRPAENSKNGYDWIESGDDAFWNLGTEEYPVKNKEHDPCPEGWRVPTEFEFQSLIGYVHWEWKDSGLSLEDAESLFLPAGGRLNAPDGLALDRLVEGYYWTVSTPVTGTSAYLHFSAEGCSVNQQGSRAGGCQVRCVRE